MALLLLAISLLLQTPISAIYAAIFVIVLAEAMHKLRHKQVFEAVIAMAHGSAALLIAAVYQFGVH